MFAWPTLELTDYELKFVRYYKQPKLNASGDITNEVWPGVLKRVYKAQLFSQNIPEISRFTNGPVFETRTLVSRRSRVFGFTFSGDVAAWFIEIETASGEKYTNGPCLVSAMCAGSIYNAEAAVGEGIFDSGQYEVPPLWRGTESFGIMLDPNFLLLPNEALIIKGFVAPSIIEEDEDAFRQLAIGIHAWEFPEMAYSKTSDSRGV
jgi:hypothetical protein